MVSLHAFATIKLSSKHAYFLVNRVQGLMTTDIAAIVNGAVKGLGFELVDFERAGGGMMRVFIDKPDGISVENCADVSNHLTRLFMVENIDYSRLEVSSPGLDRPLKSVDDFKRFIGSPVKVRLNATVDNRKRFDGTVESVDGEAITFKLLVEPATASKVKTIKRSNAKSKSEINAAGKQATGDIVEEKRITVRLDDVERARLIPDV